MTVDYRPVTPPDYEPIRRFLTENGWAHRVADPERFARMMRGTDRAVAAFLRGEAGNDIVEERLLDVNTDCIMHAVNLCEVYYDALRAGGPAAGAEAVRKTEVAGVTMREDMTTPFWQLVGQLKVSPGRVSLADCFVLALAIATGGTLVTADHEFDAVVPLGLCPILFIR